MGRARGEPVGADDAAEARAFMLGLLPRELAFDHAQIVADYLGGKGPGGPVAGPRAR